MPAKRTVFIPCKVPDCPNDFSARGYCVRHYNSWYSHGDPLYKSPYPIPVEARFWTKVHKTDSCWLWKGKITKKGYAWFSMTPNHQTAAYRYAYTLLVGPIPEGMEIDHLCRNRACVNPDHLEPVGHVENVKRGAIRRRQDRQLNRPTPRP